MGETAGRRSRSSETLYGVKIFPGIVIGRIRVAGGQMPRVEHIYLPEGEAADEMKRFKAAVAVAESQLREIRNHFADAASECAAIIDSHLFLLGDPVFHERTLSIIGRQEINAEWALAMSLARVKEVFDAIEDPFLRERFLDLEQVAARLQRILSGEGGNTLEVEGEQEGIVVGRDLAPEDIVRLTARRKVGLAVELGSLTAHSAIVARNLGIPTIMGVSGLTARIADGDLAVLDGYLGRLIVNPTEEQLQQAKDQLERARQYGEKLAFFSHLAPETRDGRAIAITANAEMAEECSAALQYGATGIGLFRSEYSYMTSRQLPGEEELFATYRDLLQNMAPFPVTVRTIDAGGDKVLKGLGMHKEKNPALGLRAIRLALLHEDVLRTQLRALFRASMHGKLRLLWPMISSPLELERIGQICREVKDELRAADIAYSEAVDFGVMIEVPGAVAMADVMAAEVDFFSIGTNDLIQYTLAVDRGNPAVAHLYDPFNPSVLRMIKQVVDSGHAGGIEVGICGEMAADLACIPLLLGFGVDEFSMTPLAIPYVKRLVRSCRAEDLEDLADHVLTLPSSRQVQQALAGFLEQHCRQEVDAALLDRLRQADGDQRSGLRGNSITGAGA